MNEPMIIFDEKLNPRTLTRRAVAIGLGGLLVGAGTMGLYFLYGGKENLKSTEYPPIAGEPQKPNRENAPSAKEIAEPRLNEAKFNIDSFINDNKGDYFNDIAIYFNKIQGKIPALAESFLGWKAKYNFLYDLLPFIEGGNFKKFINEEMNKCINKPELERIIKNTAKRFNDELEEIENKMLVDLRADISRFPETFPIGNSTDANFKELYNKSMQHGIESIKSYLFDGTGSYLTAYIAERILITLANRLGVSGSLLGFGFSNSWWNFGLSIIFTAILDQIVGYIWNWFSDPHGDLVNNLRVKINKMQKTTSESITESFKKISNERDSLRRKIIYGYLSDPNYKFTPDVEPNSAPNVEPKSIPNPKNPPNNIEEK